MLDSEGKEAVSNVSANVFDCTRRCHLAVWYNFCSVLLAHLIRCTDNRYHEGPLSKHALMDERSERPLYNCRVTALFVDASESCVWFGVWMVCVPSKIKCDIQKVDVLLVCFNGDMLFVTS